MIHPLFGGHACEHEYINGMNMVGGCVCAVESHQQLTVTRLEYKTTETASSIIQQQWGEGRNMDGLITAILSNSLEICVWRLEDRFDFFHTRLMISIVLGWCISCNSSNLFFSTWSCTFCSRPPFLMVQPITSSGLQCHISFRRCFWCITGRQKIKGQRKIEDQSLSGIQKIPKM